MSKTCLNAYVLLLALLVYPSCKYLKKGVSDKDEMPVARVNDKYLYYSDIKNIIRKTVVIEDSAQVIRNYIDDWIKHNLVLQKAATYLPPEKLDVQKQVNNYRESLIIHLYERELILQKLDTAISVEEIRRYYEDFKGNFELREDIIQFYYIKLANTAPKLDSIKAFINAQSETDKIKLTDYCFQYAEDFSISDSAWFEIERVYQQLPIRKEYMDMLIQYNSSGIVQDSNYTYLLKVNSFKIKGELAPFNYIINDISKIILNKRKVDLINSTYRSLYQDGVKSGSFEIYQ